MVLFTALCEHQCGGSGSGGESMGFSICASILAALLIGVATLPHIFLAVITKSAAGESGAL